MATSSGTRSQVRRLPLENIRREDTTLDRSSTPREEPQRVTPRRSPRGELQTVTPERRKVDANEEYQPSASGQPPASARSWQTVSPIKPPTVTSSRLTTPRSLDDSCTSSQQGRRGKMQRLSEKDVASSPATSESTRPMSFQDEGRALISSVVPVIPHLDTLLPGVHEAHSYRARFANELMWDDSFLVASDRFSACMYKLLGCVSIVIAIVCLYLAAIQHDANVEANLFRFALLIISSLMLLLSVAIFFRFRAPVSLRILRVEGMWSVSINRRGLSPKIRPLMDLEAFVETFGYCSRMNFWGKKIGFATSKHGTVHLIFSESSHGPSMAFSASLQNALPFFIKLCDVLTATAHPLTAIVAEYIADWESDTSLNRSAA